MLWLMEDGCVLVLNKWSDSRNKENFYLPSLICVYLCYWHDSCEWVATYSRRPLASNSKRVSVRLKSVQPLPEVNTQPLLFPRSQDCKVRLTCQDIDRRPLRISCGTWNWNTDGESTHHTAASNDFSVGLPSGSLEVLGFFVLWAIPAWMYIWGLAGSSLGVALPWGGLLLNYLYF